MSAMFESAADLSKNKIYAILCVLCMQKFKTVKHYENRTQMCLYLFLVFF